MVEQGRQINPVILEAVKRNSERFGVAPDQILGRSRVLSVVQARHVTTLEAHDAGLSVTELEKEMERNHSTINNSIMRGRALNVGKEKSLPTDLEIFQEATTYLEANFPGVTIEDLRRPSRLARYGIPRMVLSRFLFYDKGANISKISSLFGKHFSSIWLAVNRDEKGVVRKTADWRAKEEKRTRRFRIKEERKRAQEAEINRTAEERQRTIEEEERIVFEAELGKQQRISKIIQVVADNSSLSVDELKSPSRLRRISRPRQIAAYLLDSDGELDLTYKSIASDLGLRDQTTILYAINRVRSLRDEDPEFNDELDYLSSLISSDIT